MPNTLTIRRWRPADAAAIWRLHNEALDAVDAHGGNGPWDDDLHHIENVYITPGGDFLVGELDGGIVAMGGLERRERTTGAIRRMRVAPAHHRRGFGQAILAALEARARELGLRRLVLDTTTVQEAAIALYEANGYRRTGERTFGRFRVIDFEKLLGD